ncbi:MAG TPA: polyphosphate polymerase domain-containing protein [Bacillota bacterium]|nr:polyphosphate polymerase domain-containing protein [Bacillota bacterium]HOK69534.1 polyphosphate polymerase domain-containing protein [Bacillota bacterium]HPP85932.1 polyphosphate polymerase domain-containing protein [Bacillota bacterium]
MERIEEKYILDYRQYAVIKNRVAKVLRLDAHNPEGSYQVSSLYFDDPYYTAYYEKTDGLAVHTKFRIRTYNCSENMIKLEKKTKRGVKTEKESAVITGRELAILSSQPFQTDVFSGKLLRLAAELQSKGMRPVLTVRYNREAYYLDGLNVRVTFDTRIQTLPPEPASLFDKNRAGIPVIHPLNVIMEIKYNGKLPDFIRILCRADAPQLSVSKYALCASCIKQTAGFYREG